MFAWPRAWSGRSPGRQPGDEQLREDRMHQTWVVATLALATSCVVSSPRLGMAQSPSGREDEEAIRKVIVATTEGFNQHDAKAATRMYTPDADLVTWRGEWFKGREKIEKELAAIFATRAKDATKKTLDVTVRFIRPDIAVAHVT